MASKRRTFWLHFNRLNIKHNEADVWTVHLSNRCIQTRKVLVKVPLETIFKGREARQPRAYLKGKGVIKVRKGFVRIT